MDKIHWESGVPELSRDLATRRDASIEAPDCCHCS